MWVVGDGEVGHGFLKNGWLLWDLLGSLEVETGFFSCWNVVGFTTLVACVDVRGMTR